MEALLKELNEVQTFYNPPTPQTIEVPVKRIPTWAIITIVVVGIWGLWVTFTNWQDRQKAKATEAEKQRLKAALARYGLPTEA